MTPREQSDLYARYFKKTVAYAIKALGRDLADHAEDIAQGTWIDIFKRDHFPTLGVPPHPEHRRLRYLFTIVSRKAGKLRRKLEREAQKANLLAVGEEIATSPERGRKKNRCDLCNRPTARRNLCEAHYYRRRRRGAAADPSPTVKVNRKLSDAQVAEIREKLAAGEKGAHLATAYGVKDAQISRIKHRQRRSPKNIC